MKAPTPEEIHYGYDKITEDGPVWANISTITSDLAVLATFNPQIKDTLNRMLFGGLRANLFRLSADGLGADGHGGAYAALCGALIFGLHLGLHIGEARVAAEVERLTQALREISIRGTYGEGELPMTTSELREIAREALP